MKTLIITLTTLLITLQASATAYPIEPRPLRKLIAESEFIVIGHVVGLVNIQKPDNSFENNTMAKIEVREVLKGSIKETIIEVPFNPNYICPAPPHYEANTDVVVFLDRTQRTWRRHALSYGVKTLAPEDIAIYRTRIVEMQKIQAMSDAYSQFFEIVEWLVKCVEHPATRWEGTYELSPESDFMSYYARSEFKPFQSMLSQAQRDRLKNVLFENDQPGYADIGLIDLVYVGNEQAVDQYMLNALKQLSDYSLFLASEYMERLLRRNPNPENGKSCGRI
jgi:hypothetical protein